MCESCIFLPGMRVRYKWNGMTGTVAERNRRQKYWDQVYVKWDADTPGLHRDWKIHPLSAHPENLEIIAEGGGEK